MNETVEAIESQIAELKRAIPRCEHNEVIGRCPYCDKCEHGMTLYQDCRACHANDDNQTWQQASITGVELYQLDEELRQNPDHAPWRCSPHRLRNYRATPDAPNRLPVWGILLRDYRRLLVESRQRSATLSRG